MKDNNKERIARGEQDYEYNVTANQMSYLALPSSGVKANCCNMQLERSEVSRQFYLVCFSNCMLFLFFFSLSFLFFYTYHLTASLGSQRKMTQSKIYLNMLSYL